MIEGTTLADTPQRTERRLAAILAADVAGYSRLMGADEDGTLRALKQHRASVFDPQIAGHRGRIVKTTGDGLLVEFASVVDAVECAWAVQRGIAERNAEVPPGKRLEFRIGINLGDVIIDDGDIYGDGVNIAARLEALAVPGGICVSGAVCEQLRDKRSFGFEDLGERTVKNIARPLHVYRLVALAEGTAAALSATVPGTTLLPPDRPSIAVLPFTNLSGDAEQDYFADGMVEDIITALSRFKEFFVIARNSTFVYKGRAVDIQQVARELGVRYVLEGSVRRDGTRVRITGQLLDAETRLHLWANRFEGAVGDVFDLQDRITESVVGALAPTLRQAEIARARRKPPANLDAYDYLLRALPLTMANTAGEAAEAIKLLAEALRLDDGLAPAHAFMSHAYGQIFRSAAGPARDDACAKAVAHARRAIETAGEDSTALAHAGFALLIAAQDIAGARAAVDKAVALNPNLAAAYAYRSLVRAMTGEPDAAMQDAHRALRLNPLDPTCYLPQMAMLVAHFTLHRYDDAVVCAHRAIEHAPPRYPMSYAWLIVAECARGNTAEAERQMTRLADILPGFGPAMLERLFEFFPDPLRSEAVATLRHAGVVRGRGAEG